MNVDDQWLGRFAHLNVYKAMHGRAPHKPLLLLVFLEMAERGELPNQRLSLTPEVSFRFNTFWQVVAYRRTQPPDVRMPFFHLGSDKILIPMAASGELAPHRDLTTSVEIDAELFALIHSPAFRERARRILIATYFEPAERNALYNLAAIAIPSNDEIARDAHFEFPDDSARVGREARFRLDIVPAYNYTCALTGYRVTTIGAGSIVDAAHIHQFSDSRNNDPSNGLALCKNAHWLFDAGLWSADDDFRVLVKKDAFSESSPKQDSLFEMQGQRLLLPTNEAIWPAKKHLAWHRTTHKFYATTGR